MNKRICLVGNPNCGKTTLFNLLTGTYQRVGNFSGVTTTAKIGSYKKNKNITIIDLPGMYSLSSKSVDELEAINFLKNQKIDCIINVLDGTNLRRNLYLTSLLRQLNIPVVVAINYYDDLIKNNININVSLLEEILGVPVIMISALKNKNVSNLMEIAIKNTKTILSVEAEKSINDNIDKIIKNTKTKLQDLTNKIDKVVLNKYLSIPILIAVLTLVYYFSLSIGGLLADYLEGFFKKFITSTEQSLLKINCPKILSSIYVDAILKGVLSVISFLPHVLVLFALLTIVEESGYASRMVFITDGIFKKFGLSGKSVIPIMLSCGCTVNGIMSSRNIERKSERNLTIFLSPFMPCGAKSAVFGYICGLIFDRNPLVATSTYFLAIFCILVSGKILSKFKNFNYSNDGFILELPTYRLPSIKDIFYVLFNKVKEFLVKAGSVIFLMSIILWLLRNFGIGGYVGDDFKKSFLFLIGSIVSYLFIPLGFNSYELSVSMLSGIFAKEAIIETLIYLSNNVTMLFKNNYSAYAFIAFILCSPPCIASLVTAKEELKDKKLFIFMIIYQICFGYLLALVINLLGIILSNVSYLIFPIIAVIISIVLIVTGISAIKSHNCTDCKNCKIKGKKRCKKNTNQNMTT